MHINLLVQQWHSFYAVRCYGLDACVYHLGKHCEAALDLDLRRLAICFYVYTQQLECDLTHTAEVCGCFVCEPSCTPVYVLTGSQSGLLWNDKDTSHPSFAGPVKKLSPAPHRCRGFRRVRYAKSCTHARRN